MPSITQREMERLQRVERQAASDRAEAEGRQSALADRVHALLADLDRVRQVALGQPVSGTVRGEAQWGTLTMAGYGDEWSLTPEARLQRRLDRAQDQAAEAERRLAAVVAAVDMARAR